jgi:hypothetical protein
MMIKKPIASGDGGSNRNHINGQREVHLALREANNVISLVYHLFEHDMNMTFVRYRQPILSYAEMTLPFPASRSLWLAPSAEIWRTRYLDEGWENLASFSLHSLLIDESLLRCLPDALDAQMIQSAYLHGIAAQIWEHSQQLSLVNAANDASAQLWSQSRQQKL